MKITKTNIFAQRSAATTILWPTFLLHYYPLLDLAFTPSQYAPQLLKIYSFSTAFAIMVSPKVGLFVNKGLPIIAGKYPKYDFPIRLSITV